MKQFLSSLCIIAILSCSSGTPEPSLDNLQDDSSMNDFNIVLITIDTLRADHLSCYGYERKTSPNIDKIAEKGIIFKNTTATSSWTAPSMVSLLTSVYPINHGVMHGLAIKKTMYGQEVFSDELTTLAHILNTHGYTTFAAVSNLHLSEKFGFARGFDYFKCVLFPPAPLVNKIIYSWEDEIKKSDKYFLWIHYMDPHFPYHARNPWIDQYTSKALTQKLKLSKKSMKKLLELIPMFEKDTQALSNLIALYDSEINYVDFYIGELIQKFELDKNTLIIITSDHGEEFLEHGLLGHSNNLYQETIHIPLIVKLPHSTKEGTVEKLTNLVDIMPTILHVLDISPPNQTLGTSVWEKKRKDYNFSELGKSKNHIIKTILTSEWKYIHNYNDETEQLYNIKSDPLELSNLADKKTKQRNHLNEQLSNWVSHSRKYYTKRQPFHPSPKEKEKLKSLGYIQ